MTRRAVRPTAAATASAPVMGYATATRTSGGQPVKWVVA